MSFNPFGNRDKEELETPDWLFNELDAEFEFELDAAATRENKKCAYFYDKDWDAFKQDWALDATSIWCNPPYGRGIGKWIAKAKEARDNGARVVMLLPSKTGTHWWHDYIWDSMNGCPRPGVEIRFLAKRLTFKGEKWPAKFDSVVVIFHPQKRLI